jgi:hypothetical protein
MAEPLYSEPQVTPQAAPSGYVQASATPETFGAGVGQSIQGLGDVLERAQEEAKNIRVNDQVNQLTEKSLDLAYGKDGYRNILGGNVLKTPNGKPLTEDYSQRFEDFASQARAQLSTPQQQALFDRRAILIRKNYMRGLEGHEQQQVHAFADETDKGTINTQADAAVKMWNDPAYTDTAVAASDAAWASYGQRNGLPANQVQELQQQSRSTMYTKVLQAALDGGDTTYAESYFKHFGSDMTGEDAMKAGVLINGKAGDNLAFSATQHAYQDAVNARKAQGDPGAALIKAVQDVESGGNPDAVSPKGAKGLMQVMDATNGNPGFGVTPAKDDSPQERARVGRDYLGAMISRYGGDLQKGLAAYNAGPGAVDEALKESSKDVNQGMKNPDGTAKTWMDYLPDETKAYVPSVMSKLDKYGNSGPAPLPSMDEFTSSAIQYATQQNGGPLNPTQMHKVMTNSEQTYAKLQQDQKQQGTQALNDAMKMVSQGATFDSLPTAVKSAVPGDDLPRLKEFSDKLQLGTPIKTDLDLYQRLTTDHSLLTQMSDQEFSTLKLKLSASDFEHFANERAALQNGTGAKGPGNLNNAFVTKTVDLMVSQLGLPTRPKQGSEQAGQVGAIRQAINAELLYEQKTNAKQFNDDELQGRIASMFQLQGTVHNMIFPNTQGSLMNVRKRDIPDADLAALQSDFKGRGIVPSDRDLVESYLELKLRQAGSKK